MAVRTFPAVRTALAVVLATAVLVGCDITITPGPSALRPTADLTDLSDAPSLARVTLEDGETASWRVRASSFDGDQIVVMTDADVLRVRDAVGRVIASSVASNRFVEGDVVLFARPMITVEPTDPALWRCEAGPCVALPAPSVADTYTVEVERTTSGFGSVALYAAGMAFYDPAEPANDDADGAASVRNDATAAHAIETLGDVDRFVVSEKGRYDVAAATDLDLRLTYEGGGVTRVYDLPAGTSPRWLDLFAGDTLAVEPLEPGTAATADGSAYEILHPSQASERLRPE